MDHCPASIPIRTAAVNSELTQYLQDSWKAVIDADVDGPNAEPVKIDAGKPLFTYKGDTRRRGLDGADVPGWKPVYVQPAPATPASFTVQESSIGPALAVAAKFSGTMAVSAGLSAAFCASTGYT